jgi:hypothetical protein
MCKQLPVVALPVTYILLLFDGAVLPWVAQAASLSLSRAFAVADVFRLFCPDFYC